MLDGGSGGALVLGALAALLFLAVERAKGERAMMPLAMFETRAFVGLSLLTFLLYGALAGLLVLLPFTLMQAAGFSPLQSGLALLPVPIVIGAASRFMGRLTANVGPRWPLSIGPAVVAAGFALLATIRVDGDYWTALFPALAVMACGIAGAVTPLTTAVLASIDDRHTGIASGLNSALARTGGLIATAATGGVLAARGADLLDASGSRRRCSPDWRSSPRRRRC